MERRGYGVETVTVQATGRPYGHGVEEGEQESLQRAPVAVVEPIVLIATGDGRQGEGEEEEAQEYVHESQVDQQDVIGGDLEEDEEEEG